MITENLSTLKIHKLTKEQYDREFEAGRIDENALYLTPDEEMDLSGYATVEQLNTKADTEHTHTTSDITDFQESLNTTINEAITQAKESGELKGEPGAKGDKGDKGEKGDKGDTPVRGTDYWTEADKAEIKSYVDELSKLGMARFASGSYVGTGTRGADNPTIIPIPFRPKILMIDQKKLDGAYIIHGYNLQDEYTYCSDMPSGTSATSYSKYHEDSAYFYMRGGGEDTGTKAQFNKLGETYYWYAFG